MKLMKWSPVIPTLNFPGVALYLWGRDCISLAIS